MLNLMRLLHGNKWAFPICQLISVIRILLRKHVSFSLTIYLKITVANPDYFVPENNVPYGVAAYQGWLYVALPRKNIGIPSTINRVNLTLAIDNKSPPLEGYPNYELNDIIVFEITSNFRIWNLHWFCVTLFRPLESRGTNVLCRFIGQQLILAGDFGFSTRDFWIMVRLFNRQSCPKIYTEICRWGWCFAACFDMDIWSKYRKSDSTFWNPFYTRFR